MRSLQRSYKKKNLLRLRQRKPTATQIAQAERKKMITFLKSALGCNVKMLYKMRYKNLVDLCTKEIKTLQGDTVKRDEVERKLKATHDLTLDKPFT